MTLRTLLIAGAAVLTLGTASLPAFAGGSTVHIEQYGWDNEFGGGQHGHRNRITLYQNGYGNSSINDQTGAYNR
ncbi:MAG: curlin, partial [Methyloceanibacter sp.]